MNSGHTFEINDDFHNVTHYVVHKGEAYPTAYKPQENPHEKAHPKGYYVDLVKAHAHLTALTNAADEVLFLRERLKTAEFVIGERDYHLEEVRQRRDRAEEDFKGLQKENEEALASSRRKSMVIRGLTNQVTHAHKLAEKLPRSKRRTQILKNLELEQEN